MCSVKGIKVMGKTRIANIYELKSQMWFSDDAQLDRLAVEYWGRPKDKFSTFYDYAKEKGYTETHEEISC